MAYGIIKVDTVTFTSDGVDKSVTLSGLVQNPTFSGNVTVTGTFSGVTVTGTTASFTSGVFASGTAAAPSISVGTTNNGIYSPGANQLALSTNGTGRLFVDSSGRLGVGTSAPSTLLHLSSATGSASPTPTELRIATTTNASDWSIIDPWGRISFYSGDTSGSGPKIHAALDVIQGGATGSSSSFSFKTSSTSADTLVERLKIDFAGNVGIGTASPSNLLDVNGTIGYNNRLLPISTSGDGTAADPSICVGFDFDNGFFRPASNTIGISTGGLERARIDSSGRLLIGTSTSTSTAGASSTVQVASSNPFTALRWNAGANPSTITLGQSRGAAPGTLSIASNNDLLSRIQFVGDDGTQFVSAASITAAVDGTPGTNDMPGRLVFSTTEDGASPPSPTERMRITSAGNVGIGSTAPESALQVNGTVSFGESSILASSALPHIYRNGGNLFIQGRTDGGAGSNVYLGTVGSTRLTVLANGNVGIGTASPGELLTVANATNTDATIKDVAYFCGNYASNSGSGARILIGGDIPSVTNRGVALVGVNTGGAGNAHDMVFEVSGTAAAPSERARIDSSGRLLVGTSSARSNFFNASTSSSVQVEGTTTDNSAIAIIRNSANSSSPLINFAKSRSTSVGGNTLVADGDQLGAIWFQGADGTEFVPGASIQGVVDGTPGTNDMPGRLVFSTTADGASPPNPTERMRIDSSGRVGIGTVSPGHTLEVNGDCQIGAHSDLADSGLYVAGRGTSNSRAINIMSVDGNGGGAIGTTGEAGTINGLELQAYRGGGSIVLKTGGSNNERVRIDSFGRLLVGTSAIQTPFSSSTLGTPRYQQADTAQAEASAFWSAYSTTATVAPNLLLGRSRGTLSAQGLVSDGDSLGRVLFLGSDGQAVGTNAGFIRAAVIEGQVDGTASAGVMPGRIVFSTTSNGPTPIERLRIDNAGTTTLTSAASTAPFIAKISTTEVARIDSAGRLLVGTSSTPPAVETLTPGFALSSAGAAVDGYTAGIYSYRNAGGSGRQTIAPRLLFARSRSGVNGSVGGIVVDGEDIGNIRFAADDGTQFLTAAEIVSEVDGTPGANDMPGRIVLSTTLDGASSPTERLRITNDGVQCYDQAAPASYAAAATLVIGDLKNGLVQYTGAAATLTLPTGTLTEGGFSGIYTNMTFEWSVINTGSGTCTVGNGTGHTVTGSATVAAGASGRFASRRTAANTFVSYRLS